MPSQASLATAGRAAARTATPRAHARKTPQRVENQTDGRVADKCPLPITDKACPAWAEDWHKHGVDDLVRCAIQGFPLRYNGNRRNQVEAPNGPSAERNPESTQRELDKELANGHMIGP